MLLAVATQISGSLPPRGPPPWAHTQDSTPPSCDPKTSHYEAFPSSPQRPARYLAAAEHDDPVLSSAARRDVFLAPAEHDDPVLSSAWQRRLFPAPAEHDDPVLSSAAGEMYLLPPRSTTTGRRATLLLLTLVFIFCCPAHCDRSSSPPHKCNVHPPCLHTSDLDILAWIWDGCGLLNVRQYVARD